MITQIIRGKQGSGKTTLANKILKGQKPYTISLSTIIKMQASQSGIIEIDDVSPKHLKALARSLKEIEHYDTHFILTVQSNLASTKKIEQYFPGVEIIELER